jgi:predicted nucleic acid-binding protein
MNVLLDSDIVIEVQRARDVAILSKWTELKKSDFVIFFSPVTAAEVWAGARANEHVATASFFRTLKCAPADDYTGELAGEYLRHYSKSHSLDIADALIAATAIQQHAALWTRNRKHYPMPQLTFFN